MTPELMQAIGTNIVEPICAVAIIAILFWKIL